MQRPGGLPPETFLALFEAAPVGIALVRAGGKIIHANPHFCSLLGYDLDELRSLGLDGISHPDDRSADGELARQLMAGEIPSYAMIKRFLRKDGSLIWAKIDVSLHRKQDGTPDFAFGFITDVSEQIAAERALQEANETLEAMLHASPVAILILDKRGRVRRWNPAAEAIFGWTAEEVMGKHNPIVPEDKREEFEEHFRTTLEGPPQHDVERSRRCKDGSTVSVSLSTAPLHDSLGRVIGAVGLILDLSERKATEAERVDALTTCQAALAEVDRLRGLLPICASCKKIRDEEGVWHAIEAYVRERADVQFSHGICPGCKAKLYPDY